MSSDAIMHPLPHPGAAAPDSTTAVAGPRTPRAERWAATMAGYLGAPGDVGVQAHAGPARQVGPVAPLNRAEREAAEEPLLAPGATRARGPGRRARPEEPDALRTCFERDRDRILHASAFRRLAGKTQVFVAPEDHQRTRLTHALEVAQVAGAIARAGRLNVVLAEAIALGHDCGHGPGGHASEEALAPFLTEGFDHARWGADVVLAPLNLTVEVLDGVRNHSWSRPAPMTPEGEVVSWADRIAYVCHDFEDAVHAGVVAAARLPGEVLKLAGARRSAQLAAFIAAVVEHLQRTGVVGMAAEPAAALAAFRASNYEQIYMRPASIRQARSVVGLLTALVEHFADRPQLLPGAGGAAVLQSGDEAAVRAAVGYVAGMTDRYAFAQAVSRLGIDPVDLPAGVDWLRPTAATRSRI